jgi:hypothetical protein
MCDVLDQVGFRMRDGGLGLRVEPAPEGARVVLGEDGTPLPLATDLWSVGSSTAPDGRYGRGLNTAMVVAVAAVLRQAGYRVRVEDLELIVSAEG